MRKAALRLAIVAAACVGHTPTIFADSLTITGSLDISGSPTSFAHVGTLELSRERGLAFSAVVNGAFGRYDPRHDCYLGCAPGSALDLFALWVGGHVGRPKATLEEGVTYTELNRANSRSGVGVEFTGTAALPQRLTPSAVITAPFRCRGLFVVGDGPPSLHGRYDLFGLDFPLQRVARSDAAPAGASAAFDTSALPFPNLPHSFCSVQECEDSSSSEG